MDVSSLFSFPTTWLVTATSVVYFIYWYGSSTFNFFSEQGIPGPKPIPYFGNLWGMWRENMPKKDKVWVEKYGRVFGSFDGTLPNLWTTDADLIKSIFVKDFDHFINRREFIITQKVFRKMVSLVRDQEWKEVRSSITPAFTTGKIKRMSIMIKECADRLVVEFQNIAESDRKIDAKKQFSAFTMDVIARCAFGMAIDNLGGEDDPFMKKAKEVFSPPINKSPIIIIPFIFPKLMFYFGERILGSEGFNFFFDVLKDLVKQRADSTEKYHDFVEVATEAILEHTKKADAKDLPVWNREEVDEIVIAQSVLFLLAGFDTTATTLTNTIFLLARNAEVQEKLYEEITKKHEEFDDVNHDMILNFPYVDHVINEVLRMYPPVPRIERTCNKDVTYNGIHIKKGMIVTVPSFALHYDEEYYPEPNRFNPDRWDPESGIKPNQNVFMPFGMGPRNCVGLRFAMEEMKIALCTILKNFRFFPVAETPVEMEFEDGFLGVTQAIQAIVGIETR